MRLGVTFRIVGGLLMFFSATMLPPLFVSVFYQDGAHAIFIKAAAVIFASGFSLWLLFRRFTEALRTKDGFLVTVLCYITLGCFSALPFTDSPNTALSLVDALFESFSGLTTTGATVMVGLESLPQSLLYYRQQLQWLGGMGIIVLAVSRIPLNATPNGAVIWAGVIAIMIFGTGTLYASKPKLNKNIIAGLALVGACAVLAGGIVAAVDGEREFHPHHADDPAEEHSE